MDCCDNKQKHTFDFDLAIIGSGSAAFAAAIKAVELGKTVAIIEKETLGGTCVNVGCVPSKTLIRAAEAKRRMEISNFSGIAGKKTEIDFKKIMAEKSKLVEELRIAKYQAVLDQNKAIKHINGIASIISDHRISIDDKAIITADKIIISTGSVPLIPDIPGLIDSDFLTSRSVFELKTLPKSVAVLGGGYISLEISQMLARFGTRVTIIQRSKILSHEDRNISEDLEKHFLAEGIEIFLHAKIKEILSGSDKKSILFEHEGISRKLEVDHIIVATGRRSNTQGLNLEKIGVKVDKDGSIIVNEYGQTSRSNIYAAGDVLNTPSLVYVAAYEGNLAAENALTGNARIADYSTVPWVIFSDPQVAGVGLNEEQAKLEGIEYDTSLLTLDHVPRCIAARDCRGFVKLLRKRGHDQLIGARVVAPEGAELIMELSMILRYKIPLSEVANMFHPYLTLSEAVKLAAQTFDKDVSKLSCCAS